jgi:hypothetical protein
MNPGNGSGVFCWGAVRHYELSEKAIRGSNLYLRIARNFMLIIAWMDKANLFDTLINLQKEVLQRLTREIHSTNDPQKLAGYNRQLRDIQSEIERINRGKPSAR